MRMVDDCRYWLVKAGIEMPDADELRRIAMQLHRWHELECGDNHGCIERDESDGLPYWLSSYNGRRHRIADKEKGALKRLAKVMAKYPGAAAYVQGDPRGAALYILPASLNPLSTAFGPLESNYTRGIAVHK